MTNLMKKTTDAYAAPVPQQGLTPRACLLTAATLAAGTQAYGAAVRFENDTNFDWYFTTLDVTLPASAQTYGSVFDVTGNSVYLDYFSDFYPAFSYQHSYTRGNGAEVWSSGFSNRYSAPLNSGELIGSGLEGGAWSQFSTLEFAFQEGDPYYYYYYRGTNGFRGLLPPDGSDTYIGLRLTIEGAQHYGWVGVQNFGGFIEVFAWGYETEAGVPVPAGVPSPGPASVLALGAVGALRRPTRSA